MALPAQLLVVSPDGALLRIVQRCVESLGHNPLIARSVPQAHRLLSRADIDLICFDSVLSADEIEDLWRAAGPARDGRRPRALFFGPPSARLLSTGLPSFLRGKVDGFVTKPVEVVELVRELARALAGRSSRPRRPDLVQAGGVALDGATHNLFLSDGAIVPLTPTEYKLLRFLMQRTGQFVSTEDLLEQVWGYPRDSGPELVRAHVSNLRRKLRSACAAEQLLRTMPYVGYGFFAEAGAGQQEIA